ncbi:MAG: TolC family protein, partial [Gammaproteobacteria bacterium]|nr:TolC family protein [Gammaproteobacteria bacterium]
MKSFVSQLPALAATLVLAGCAVSAISPEVRERDLPDSWSEAAEYGAVSDGWLAELGDTALSGLVDAAMERNYRLAQLAADVEAAQQGVIISGAARLPDLSLAFSPSRRRVISNQFGITRTSSNFEIGVDLAWEIDAWGKLRDFEKQAGLKLMAAQARYADSRNRLAARVARAWFNVAGAGELLALFRERLANLEEDLDIID